MQAIDPVATPYRRTSRRRRLVKPMLTAATFLAVTACSSQGTVPDPSPSATPPSSTSPSTPSSSLGPTTYFIDCAAADQGDGSWERPWQSPAQLASTELGAGSKVSFKRGCDWQGRVKITGQGTASQPITVSAHGTGRAPRLNAPGAEGNDAVVTVSAAHTVISNVHISGGTSHGLHMAGEYGVARDLEIEGTAFGVRFTGSSSTATNVSIHDLVMFRNTPGGDDDAGAVGFVVEADDVTVANSSCTNCRAPSYDYGHDGGFIEIWQQGDRLKILNNRGMNTQGFLEAGGENGTGSAVGVVIRGNIMKSCHGGAINLHQDGKFAIQSEDVLVEGNTFDVTAGGTMFSGNTQALTLRNNTLSVGGRSYEPTSPS